MYGFILYIYVSFQLPSSEKVIIAFIITNLPPDKHSNISLIKRIHLVLLLIVFIGCRWCQWCNILLQFLMKNILLIIFLCSPMFLVNLYYSYGHLYDGVTYGGFSRVCFCKNIFFMLPLLIMGFSMFLGKLCWVLILFLLISLLVIVVLKYCLFL